MKRLLALVDGSPYARSVCDHAAWVAGRTGAAVTLLHVIGRRETDSAPSDLSGSLQLGARTALLKELSALDEERARLAQRRGRALLEDAKARLQAGGLSEVTAQLRFGDLVETVAASEADLLVVGKRGEAAGYARLHLGSNLERVARSSQRPLLVASRDFSPIRRVLIAYDGGPSGLRALDALARAPLFAGLACRLVTAGAESPETVRDLERAQALLTAGGHEASAEIRPGPPEAAIARAIEERPADLLVMGAYGHSRIRRLVIGSTTAEMLRSSRVPVLLFR